MPPRSKIATLPEDVRRDLDQRLIERGFGSHAELAEWLQSQGFEIARPSVQRHSQQLERRIEQVRLATEGAEALVAAAGDDRGAVADAGLRMVQQKLYDVLLASDEGDLKSLAAAARALADTARASTTVRQERRKVLREAAAAAGKAARRAGVSGDTEALIRKAIEGAAG